MNDIICLGIAAVDKSGITLKTDISDVYISFDECIQNYAKENSLKMNKCVAVRDVTILAFVFYTDPKTTVSFKQKFLRGIFTRKSAAHRFWELQTVLNKYGYTSYDLS